MIEIRGYRPICARCIPDQPCACGWAPEPEPCDGEVPQGLTCERFGFNAGKIRCTERCELDTHDCHSVASPRPAWMSQLAAFGREVSTSQSLAIGARALLVAGVHGSDLTAGTFQTATKFQIDGTFTASPPVLGNDPTLGDVFSAPLGERFLIATSHVGERDTQLFLTETSGWPKTALRRVRGRPIALAGGADGALLVTTSGYVRLSSGGTQIGPLQPLFEVAAMGEALHGAAVRTDDGWIAAVAVRTGSETVARVDLARIGREQGATVTSAAARISDAYDPLELAASGTSAWLIFIRDQELFAAPIDSGARVGAEQRLGEGGFNRVLAAHLEGGQLNSWAASERGHVRRFSLDLSTGEAQAHESVDFTAGEVEAGTAGAGAFFATFRGGSQERMYLYREAIPGSVAR